MYTKLTKSSFEFNFCGAGHYLVKYTSRGKTYRRMITDMTMIDATKNAEAPSQRALGLLRYKVLNG